MFSHTYKASHTDTNAQTHRKQSFLCGNTPAQFNTSTLVVGQLEFLVYCRVNWRQRAHVERTGEKSSVWECVVVHGGKCGLRNCLMFNSCTHTFTHYLFLHCNKFTLIRKGLKTPGNSFMQKMEIGFLPLFPVLFLMVNIKKHAFRDKSGPLLSVKWRMHSHWERQ